MTPPPGGVILVLPAGTRAPTQTEEAVMSYGTETYEESGSAGNDYYCYENGCY
ncbi:hypothetical protein [Cryptosporangium sp. NPDC051539]|uniref:hypothetical protein n=1 Tax=Cryptosporangium sp. NPDC051539 TaxID=3363962 RepID=UPI0037971C6B